jgi:glycosyltransferase involved in cell wall biosynthesis
MNRPLVSIVIPTRDRPAFIEAGISAYLGLCALGVEVIISDNSTSNTNVLRNVEACLNTPIKYVRAPNSMGMVQHWNFAFEACSGEYIGFFTDKTFPLQREWQKLIDSVLIQSSNTDIINWTSDDYYPKDMFQFFGVGHYLSRSKNTWLQKAYEPKHELFRRLNTKQHRDDMGSSDYARGKICFGLYHRRICEHIKKGSGQLFHPYSPDYTSMSLALSVAKDAVEVDSALVIQVNTNISNGGRIQFSNVAAKEYQSSVAEIGSDSNLPINGLYSSLSNVVLHDLLLGPRLLTLSVDYDAEIWLSHMSRDLLNTKFVWDSPDEKVEQIKILNSAVQNHSLTYPSILQQKENLVHSAIRKFPFPEFIKRIYRFFRYKGTVRPYSSLIELLEK